MNKYALFEEFLRNQKGKEISLTFMQIESIIGDKLPKSAYHHGWWWVNNDKTHIQSYSWGNAGWRVIELELGQLVIFEKL